VTPEVCCDAPARDSPDLGRDDLDDGQKREAQGEGPGEAVAELRADLAVRADAAGVVVGCPRDEARAEFRQERAPTMLCQMIPQANATAV